MPRENRLIIFSYEEVYKAIYTLCTQRGIQVPVAGRIDSITYNQKDKSRILLNIIDSKGDETKREEYSHDFFAAALMLYCRGLGIPLPKSANKSVSLMDDNEVALRIKI